MRALLLHVGEEVYGIDIRDVAQVLPLVRPRPVPGAPPFVAGVFSYRGTVVPVLDIRSLLEDQRALARLSTRIVLVRCRAGETVHAMGRGPDEGAPASQRPAYILGLLAERVTEIATVERQGSTTAAPGAGRDSFLGDVAVHGDQLVQLIQVDQLLTPQIRAQFFAEAPAP